MAKWSLMSMVYGIPETVLPFVAHHLQSDVEEILIFLDAPDPLVQAALATQPRVRVILCDDAWWSRRKAGRPPNAVMRQLFNLSQARRMVSTPWLVHIDSDEFLVPAGVGDRLTLSDEFDRIAPDHLWASIGNVERVMPAGQAQAGIFDGLFRAPCANAELTRRAYGGYARFLTRGLTGHTRGKIAIRPESALEGRIHHAQWPPGSGKPRPERIRPLRPEETPPFHRITDTVLLHFDGWTDLNWLAKLLRMADAGLVNGQTPGRGNAIQFVMQTQDPAEWRALARGVRRIPTGGAALLEAEGLLRRLPFDAEPVTRRFFPDVAMDFSVAAFDARAIAANPAFYARHGLTPG